MSKRVPTFCVVAIAVMGIGAQAAHGQRRTVTCSIIDVSKKTKKQSQVTLGCGRNRGLRVGLQAMVMAGRSGQSRLRKNGRPVTFRVKRVGVLKAQGIVPLSVDEVIANRKVSLRVKPPRPPRIKAPRWRFTRIIDVSVANSGGTTVTVGLGTSGGLRKGTRLYLLAGDSDRAFANGAVRFKCRRLTAKTCRAQLPLHLDTVKANTRVAFRDPSRRRRR